ncbi:MAG: LolA family protein [Candidatus Puniceispirillaceae bacterium]
MSLLMGYSPAVRADAVQQAENWFANVTTMRADFTQIASDGSAAEGKIVMRRPSRLKITYDGVPALNLITTPVWLHVDQPDERRVTSYPISETPLSLILTDPVSLRPAGYETIVTARAGGITHIAINKDNGEGAGRLTLEFTDRPFQLRRWIVEDVAGVKTSVTLQNMAFGLPVENAEFSLPNYLNQ